jgi:hypothetical protein
MKDHAYRFGKATLFPFGSGLHTHQPVISCGSAPRRSCSVWNGDKQLRAGFGRGLTGADFT